MKERIKKIRRVLGLTQREFAQQIGMKANTIATYEMGRAFPSDPAINNICKTFNVNETWLRTGEGDTFTQKSPEDEITEFCRDILCHEPDFRRRFIAALAKLNPSQWDLLEDVARTLSGELQTSPDSDSKK